MVESTLWHPVALSGAVAGQAPLAVQLLEQPVVLWRDSEGAVLALADQCPHRGARLSLGRVTPQGQLECPYHGWQFAAGGQCTHCLLYTSPSPRDRQKSRMPSSA